MGSACTLAWPLSSSLYPQLLGAGQGQNSLSGILAGSRFCPCSATPVSPQTSYSVLKRLAFRPKTQFTPYLSAPRVQQARQLSGLSPQSCPEEPAPPWEQIAVRLFDQESCASLQAGPSKPPVATHYGPHPCSTPSLQELKMQRISILQQLLRQEVEGLAGSKCAPLNGGSSLDMVELQPVLAEVSRTLNASENNSGAFHPPELLEHSGMPKPRLPEECGEAQPCPPAEPGPPESCHRREPEIPEFSSPELPEVSEPCPPAEPGLLQTCSQGQTGLPEPFPRVEPGASEACSLEPKSPESNPQPSCNQWAPAATSLIFSSQRPLCASPPICSHQSVRPPTGQTGKELVGRGCEQRRSSSRWERGLCSATGGPVLAFLLPCPSLALFLHRKERGAAHQALCSLWAQPRWGYGKGQDVVGVERGLQSPP